MKKSAQLLITVAIIFYSIMVFHQIKNHEALNHVSGAWTVLSTDLSNGVWYRSIIDKELGFGGTRFFPLYFVIHACFIGIIKSPVWAGYLTSLLSALFLIIVLSKIIYFQTKNRLLTTSLIVLFSSSATFLQGLLSIRGDLLPLSFNLLGLYIIIKRKEVSWKTIVFAAFFFSAAFATKVTSVYTLFAIVIWLYSKKEIRKSTVLLSTTFTGYFLVLGTIIFLTSGEIVTIFQECASAGASVRSVLLGPKNLMAISYRFDFLSFVALLCAGIIFLIDLSKHQIKFRHFYWIVSVLYISFLFGSPGVLYNHIVVATATSFWIIAEYLNQRFKREQIGQLTLAILTLMVVLLKPFTLPVPSSLTYSEQLIACYQEKEKVFCEDPMVAFKADSNVRPFLADAFMLALYYKNGDSCTKDAVINHYKKESFDRLIFMRDPVTSTFHYTYHFGHELLEVLIDGYSCTDTIGQWTIWDKKIKGKDHGE